MTDFPILSWMTFVPLIGAAVVACLDKKNAPAIKVTAIGASLISLGLAVRVWLNFNASTGLNFEENNPWIQILNVRYHLGVDGLSVAMVLLAALITPLAMLAHWKQDRDPKLFFFLFLLLETGMFGVFTALNFFHWFIFWELGLIPMYFLIKIWGAEERTYASFKFFIYTLSGSIGLLLAMSFLYFATGTFDFIELRQLAAPGGKLAGLISAFVDKINGQTGLTLTPQCFTAMLFWGSFLGLAIKVPIWPFHTWLPDAHTQAPTGGSMVLAAVLLKMGVYGFLRIILPIYWAQVTQYGNILMFLAFASIVFGAFAALAQTDFKRLVAYSSVNHMGYAMLGIFATAASVGPDALTDEKSAALNGAMLQMFNHGISSAALFFMVGVIYERTHTRNLADYGGLRKNLPIYAGVLGISMFSSLGLPGLNGFIGEFMIFKGVFPISVFWASLSTIGLVVTGVFLLSMMQKVCFGPLNPKWQGLPDMTGREIFIGAVLMLFMFGIGIYPAPLINASNVAVVQLVKIFSNTGVAWLH